LLTYKSDMIVNAEVNFLSLSIRSWPKDFISEK